MALAKNFLETHGLVANGEVSDEGWELFSKLLDHVGAYPNLTPGLPLSPHGIFRKFMSKVVASGIELLLIRNGKIFLTWREDNFFRGWHTPGSYIGPKEKTLEQTAQRIADREVPGITILKIEIVETVPHPESPRVYDISLLVLVEFEGEIRESERGRWFSEKPDDLLDAHEPYWPVIERCLAQSA